ncbi:hypothetical protein BBP40_007981 [Aspergillus hancockii]|nr:hypothetical protein BBP40_007981 [Aspergillus hancockii]
MPADPCRHDYWQEYAKFLEECLFILELGADEMIVFKKARPDQVLDIQSGSDGSGIYEACEDCEGDEDEDGDENDNNNDEEMDTSHAHRAYCDFEDEDYHDMVDEDCEPDLHLYSTTFDWEGKHGELSAHDVRCELWKLITKDILSCEMRGDKTIGRIFTKPALQFR